MQKNMPAQNPLKNLPDFQRRAAERLLSEPGPLHRVPSVFRQWLVWLALAVGATAFCLVILRPQEGLIPILFQLPFGAFFGLVFLGSAFAAWYGIASSMPGEEPGRLPKALMAGFLLLLFAVPFLFFARDDLKAVLDHDLASGWFCFRTVILIALPSWVLLGWRASRNASFSPGWTGAWLGVSSFLLGTGIVQAHCSHWECCHVLVNHLLPMAAFIVLPIWIGSYWFSRWSRRN